MHPDIFEPIVSQSNKREIVTKLSRFLSAPTGDVDRDLLAIRAALEATRGEAVDFYSKKLWSAEAGKWDEFFEWVGRFFREPDFDARERDYKLVVADNVRAVRSARKGGGALWPTLLKKAFGPPNNLTTWRQTEPFRRLCERDADTGARAFPGEEFRGAGGRLNLASLLQMVVDPTVVPIFQTTPLRAAYELTGFSPAPKYADRGRSTSTRSGSSTGCWAKRQIGAFSFAIAWARRASSGVSHVMAKATSRWLAGQPTSAGPSQDTDGLKSRRTRTKENVPPKSGSKRHPSEVALTERRGRLPWAPPCGRQDWPRTVLTCIRPCES